MIAVRVYPAPNDNSDFYAEVALDHVDQAETLLSSLAAYGVEYDGHLYRDHHLSGAWVLGEDGLYFGIAIDTTPTDLR